MSQATCVKSVLSASTLSTAYTGVMKSEVLWGKGMSHPCWLSCSARHVLPSDPSRLLPRSGAALNACNVKPCESVDILPETLFLLPASLQSLVQGSVLSESVALAAAVVNGDPVVCVCGSPTADGCNNQVQGASGPLLSSAETQRAHHCLQRLIMVACALHLHTSTGGH